MGSLGAWLGGLRVGSPLTVLRDGAGVADDATVGMPMLMLLLPHTSDRASRL
jgi:hypothetical protein